MITPSLLDPDSFSNHSVVWLGFLIDFAIKGVVIISAGAILTCGLRRASAATRHFVWALSMISLLVIPALSIALPAWQIPFIPQLDFATHSAQPAVSQPASAPSFVIEAPPAIVESNSTVTVMPADQVDSPPVKAASKVGLGIVSDQQRSVPRAWPAWWTLGVLTWLLGAAVVLSRLAIGSARVWLVTRKSEAVGEASWKSLSERLAEGIELTRPAVLLRSRSVRMPLTCGVLRPVVLLPQEAEKWPLARRQVVLLHELAHVKRRDCLTQMLAHIVCAFYWFNPLIWIAARQLRIEREHACDDQVLDFGTRASDYAGHLLELARTLGGTKCSTFAAVAIAKRSQLEGRLLSILDPNVRRRGIGRVRSLLAGAAVVAVIIPLAAIKPLALASDSAKLSPEQESARVNLSGSSVAGPRRTTTPAVNSAQSKGTTDKERRPGEFEFKYELDMPIEVPLEIPIEIPVNIPVEILVEDNRSDHTSEPAPTAQADPQTSEQRTKALEALREALKDEDPQIRKHAMSALMYAQDKASLEIFIAALRDPNPQIRSQAAWALGVNGDSAVVEPLIAALKDDDAGVRAKAAWALGLKGDQRAIEPLGAALKDSDPQVRSKAAWALGLKGDGSAVDALAGALKDSSPQVRSQAAWALGMKGDNRAVEPLISALKDQSTQVRAQAAWALGMRGDPRAIEPLSAAMKDESKQVREQAIRALGMLLVRSGRGRRADLQRTEDRDQETDPDPEIEVEPAAERPSAIRPLILVVPGKTVDQWKFKTKAA